MPSPSKEANHGDYRDSRLSGREPDDDDEPSSVLWVGNLSVDTLDFDLMSLFAKHGVLDCVMTFSSRNFAFLYFKHPDAAKAAKDDLQGSLVRGNSIRIEFARPAKPCKQLWIGGINPSVTKEELEEELSKFGKIEDLKINRERNSALIDFYKVDDAAAAVRNMDGKDLRGEKIRIDYLRSGNQPSRKEYSDHHETRRGFPADSSRFLPEASRHQMGNFGGPYDGPPSKTLMVQYPPSVRMDEQMLHNAMILYGEIDHVKTFPSRCTAFVEFRSVEEARRAKDGLQGRLFNDPRIHIQFASSELGQPREGFMFAAAPRQDPFFGDHPFGRTKYSHRGPMPFPPPRGAGFFDGGSSDFVDDQGFPFREGVNFSRVSPTPVNAPGTWDGGFDARESKRSRIGSPFDDASLPMRRMDGPIMRMGPGPSSPIAARRSAPGFPGRDLCWRGVIAKGGTPVCRARCLPVGKGIESPLPEVVNCSARTGLDMLAKHYEEAEGFDIVFFLPDSEEDFASYTEFLQYLRLKNRAGVAKLDDGATLFLVPPSDFLTRVLKVSGPERLYGVVLKIPQHISAVERQPTPPATRPDLAPPPPTRVDYPGAGAPPLASQQQIHGSYVGNPTEVALTPELIATLAAVIPSTAAPPAPGKEMAARAYSANIAAVGQSQQPPALPVIPTGSYVMAQPNVQQSQVDADYGSSRGYGMPSQQGVNGQRGGADFSSQLQQLQSNPAGSAPDAEADKNQRYQSTLQLAANLLLQIQQQQKQAASQSGRQ